MDTSARMVAIAAHGLAGSRTDLPAAPLSEVEWFDLVQSCIAADLVDLLASAAREGHLPVSAGQAEELEVLAAELAGLSSLVERQAATVASLLDITGIDHRVVGGPARVVVHTGGDLRAVRPVRSVRLLVAPTCLDEARALQGPAGAPGGARARGGRVVIVDDLPGLDPGPDRDLLTLLGDPTRLELDGRAVLVLSLEQQLVAACAALGSTPAPGLVSVRDVAELTLSPALDVRAARRLAERAGASDALAAGVATAWGWLDLADKTELSVWATRRVAARSGRPAGRPAAGATRGGLARRVLGRRPSEPAPPALRGVSRAWSTSRPVPASAAADGTARPPNRSHR